MNEFLNELAENLVKLQDILKTINQVTERLINGMNSIEENEKARLIEKIKKSQESVPEWT